MDKAERIIKQRRQREVSTAWIQMARFLKALKVKDALLQQNIKYMEQKRTVRKWYERTQVTLYLKRRNEGVINEFKKNEARKVF